MLNSFDVSFLKCCFDAKIPIRVNTTVFMLHLKNRTSLGVLEGKHNLVNSHCMLEKMDGKKLIIDHDYYSGVPGDWKKRELIL